MLRHKQLTLHFNSAEFDSPDLPYSGSNMESLFMERLEKARVIAGVPFKINSGYRTTGHNNKVGGKTDSSHLKGIACDIHVPNSFDRFDIVTALLLVGFTRLGIGNDFIHVDSDPKKFKNCIWTY